MPGLASRSDEFNKLQEKEAFLVEHLFTHIEQDGPFDTYYVTYKMSFAIREDGSLLFNSFGKMLFLTPSHLRNPARVQQLFTNPQSLGDYLFHVAYYLAKSRVAISAFRSLELGGNIFGLYEIFQLYQTFIDEEANSFNKGLQIVVAATSVAASILNSVALFAAHGDRFFKVGGPLATGAATMTATKNLYDTYQDKKSTPVEKALAWGGMIASGASTIGTFMARVNRTNSLANWLSIGGAVILVGFQLAQGYVKEQR